MRSTFRALAVCLVAVLVCAGPAWAGVVSLSGFVSYKDESTPSHQAYNPTQTLPEPKVKSALNPGPVLKKDWLMEPKPLSSPDGKSFLWPAAFTAGPLGEHMETTPGANPRPKPGADKTYTPMFLDEAGDGINPYGGYLAMAWRLGPLGLTLGGGYARAQSEASNGSTMSSRRFRASRSYGNQTGTGDQSQGRWAAFASVPYQITDRFGLAPEVSYYYADAPDKVGSAPDEWVMGLQFRFGF